MARRYDARTAIFSPEGRLYQVEYAVEAISLAGTAIGVLAKDGIVLAAEKKVTSKLLEQNISDEKLYVLNDYRTRHLVLFCFCCGVLCDRGVDGQYNDLCCCGDDG